MNARCARLILACLCLIGLLGSVATRVGRAGDDHKVGRHRQLNLNPFRPRGPSPEPPLTTAQLGSRIDVIAEGIKDDGTIVIKHPDVYSNAKNTKYRKDFEKQMSTELSNFKFIVSARTSRLDAASLQNSTSLGAALSSKATAPQAVDPAQNLSEYTPPNLPSAAGAQSGATLAGATAGTGIGLEPNVFLDEEKAFIDHLNDLRRMNMGTDAEESAGYALYLMRLPISITPGRKTRAGFGAEISFTAKHQFPPDFLRSSFRNFVINDLVDQLGILVYDSIRLRRSFFERLKAEYAPDYFQDGADPDGELARLIADLSAQVPKLTEQAKQTQSSVEESATNLERRGKQADEQRSVVEFYEGIYKQYLSARQDRLGARSRDLTSMQLLNAAVPGPRFVDFFGVGATRDKLINDARTLFVNYLTGDDLVKLRMDPKRRAEVFRIRCELVNANAEEFIPAGVSAFSPQRARIDEHLKRVRALGLDRKDLLGPVPQGYRDLVTLLFNDALAACDAQSPESGAQKCAEWVQNTLTTLSNAVAERVRAEAVGAQQELASASSKLAEAKSALRGAEGELKQITSELAKNVSTLKSLASFSAVSSSPSSRSSKRNFPVAFSQMPTVLLPENAQKLIEAADKASITQTPRLTDIRNYLRHELAIAYDSIVAARGARVPLFEPALLDRIAQDVQAQPAIDLRDVSKDLRRVFIDLLRSYGLENRREIPDGLFPPLAWAIALDAALLDAYLREDVARVFEANERLCPPVAGLRFYNADAITEDIFEEYVRLRWPIVSFTLDPEVDQQNIDEASLVDRDLQLALAFSFATGQINFNNLTKFRRKLEESTELIRLNRTVTSFAHANDVFGFRFFPRYQNPAAPTSNFAVIANQLVRGGEPANYRLNHSLLEGGQREQTILLIAPSFMPSIRLDTASNWFRLAHPDDEKITTPRMLEESRRVLELRALLNELCNTHQYRPQDLRVLQSKVEALEKSLPMQSKVVPLPYENTIAGFEIFTEGTSGLAPELYGFEGVDKVDPAKPADIFVFGKNISIHETNVIVGGRNLDNRSSVPDANGRPIDNKERQVNILSREVVALALPAGLHVTTLNDKKPYVEIYIATPNGISNRLYLPAVEAVKQAKPKEPTLGYTLSKSQFSVGVTLAGRPGAGALEIKDVAPDVFSITLKTASGVLYETLLVRLDEVASASREGPTHAGKVEFAVCLNPKTGRYDVDAALARSVAELLIAPYAAAPGFDGATPITLKVGAVAVSPFPKPGRPVAFQTIDGPLTFNFTFKNSDNPAATPAARPRPDPTPATSSLPPALND